MPGDYTSFKRELDASGLVVLNAEIPADLLTPASVFLRLGGTSARASFLFESVDTAGSVGRFSFIGTRPVEEIQLLDDYAVHRAGGQRTRLAREEIIGLLRSRLATNGRQSQRQSFDGLAGGWVGYFGYDWVRDLERLPDYAGDPLGHSRIWLGLYDLVVVFDHVYQTAQVNLSVRRNHTGGRLATRKLYDEAQRRLERTVARLRRAQSLPPVSPPARARIQSNMTRRAYCDGVKTIKRHIGRGDIFQCVLSQRFSVGCKLPPFDVYRRLRRTNPSPYMYFLKFGTLAIAGSSPETLVQKTGNRVMTRPIAGTRPRSSDHKKDQQLERQLLQSPKENAEHVMLVDLGRNDLGRVCRPGTVATRVFRRIDRFSHVMHMVSEVDGTMRRSADAFDLLAAAFPAGTVTGAPKIRAMEIIESIEQERRGIYAGCVGYVDWWGNLDTAITIRTVVIDQQRAYAQAGAGIVADSDPMREYRETQNKAAAPLLALGGQWDKGARQ
jgi:anthranilate synthase component 1